MDNPGVSPGLPISYPWKPVPALMGTGFLQVGVQVGGVLMLQRVVALSLSRQ